MVAGSEVLRIRGSVRRPDVPRELTALLRGRDVSDRERAWADFLQEQSDLILRVARSVARDYDDAMDHYAYVLEELRRDNFRRLRAYVSRSDAKFPIWLVAVARHLCVDRYRKKHGRFRQAGEGAPAPSSIEVSRQRLADLVMQEIDPASIAAEGVGDPDTELRQKELKDVLEDAIGCLSPRDQLLLKLRFQDEAPVREIAAIMRFPNVFHVYRRLKGTLKEVEAALKKRGVDDAEP